MKGLRRLLFGCGLLAALGSGPASAEPDQITLFIPAFEGPGALGLNVATVLNLRIWSTMRRKPWPHNPDNLDFGRGLIIWSPEPLGVHTHTAAEAHARDLNTLAQLTLWGKAYPYGGGVVVKAQLSIPDYRDFRTQRNERWEVTLGDERISTDLPRRRFELPSIVLSPNIIANYSQPSALKIYSGRQDDEVIGTVGGSFRGLVFERQLGLAKVKSGDAIGWVRLPKLSKVPTALPSFVGGIIKVFRGDWQGAYSEMQRVIEHPATRAPARIDAHLLAGLALEKRGRSGRKHFEQAVALNPYAKRSIRYLVMGELAALQRLSGQADGAARARLAADHLRQRLDREQYLFAKDDTWFAQARRIASLY